MVTQTRFKLLENKSMEDKVSIRMHIQDKNSYLLEIKGKRVDKNKE